MLSLPRWARPGPHDAAILSLAVPALLTLAADPLVSLVDTAFVGRLGTVPLAALGINTALFTMVFVVLTFLAYATTPRIGKAMGRGDREEAGRTVTQALTLAVVLGVAALALLQIFAVPLLVLLGASGPVLDEALVYLRWRALAGPALLVVTVGNGVFRGLQDTRTPLLVGIGLNLVNLVLDPILIFALGWGLAGAAIATVVAQVAGAAAFLVLLLGRRARIGPARSLPRPRELVPMLRVGGALAARTYALFGLLTAATAVAAREGVVEVAAHQVAFQVWLFLALVVDALAIAAQALIARLVGAGAAAEARAVARRLLVWGGVLGSAIGLLFLSLREVVPRAFTTDPAVVVTVAGLMWFVAVMQPVNALIFVWDGIFIALESFGFLARQMLVSVAAAAAVLALVPPLGWGVAGVWWAIVVLMLLRLGTLWWRGRRIDFGDA